jgi:transposase
MLALALLLDDYSRSKAAALNGMDRQTRRDWVHRYTALGVEGLKSRHSPGPPPALSKQQMAELRELVIKGPDPQIHKVIRWRCVDLQAKVVLRFSVEVHENTIGRWLHALGLTRLQPRVHPQKDPEADETFKKLRRPGQSPATRAPAHSPPSCGSSLYSPTPC